MKERDNFDNRYNYYFYGITDDVDINLCLKNGVKIPSRNVLSNISPLVNSHVNNDELDKIIKNYVDKKDFKYVFVFKIPTYYMGWVHRNGDMELFVPILLSTNNKDNVNKEIYVISELIDGVYVRDKSQYIINSDYNAFYDPSGLQFSDEQISKMYNYGCFDMALSGLGRNSYTYNELRTDDEINNTWGEVIKYYNSGKFKRVLSRVRSKLFDRR